MVGAQKGVSAPAHSSKTQIIDRELRCKAGAFHQRSEDTSEVDALLVPGARGSVRIIPIQDTAPGRNTISIDTGTMHKDSTAGVWDEARILARSY